MAGSTFRFVQSGDFELDRPLAGLLDVPDHLRSTLVDAPYRAASRVFDLAINERVDFVLLGGNLLHAASTGPRGWHFLNEQFERLNANDILVYWSLGRRDSASPWPSLLPLPKNVERFERDAVTRIVHERDGVAIAEICGTGYAPREALRPADFRPEQPTVFNIALASGTVDSEVATKQRIEYWALGGNHEHQAVLEKPCVIHRAGSPQGRSPEEPGAHGCVLVQVDDTGEVRSQFVPTDIVRFHTERLTNIDTTSRDQLHAILTEHIAALAAGGPDLLVTWHVSGRGEAIRKLRRGQDEQELLGRLRAEWGRRTPSIYSLEINAEPTTTIDEKLVEEQSLRGEFMRMLHGLADREHLHLDMRSYLPERQLATHVGDCIAIETIETQDRVLRDTALLGIDLLSPDSFRGDHSGHAHATPAATLRGTES